MHDALLYDAPGLCIQQKIRKAHLGRIGEIEEQMFDAWCIGIFIGFDVYDVDALFVERGKDAAALLGREPLIARVNCRYIVCHNMIGLECYGAKITIFV